MRILVTGATGFLGSHLVKRLVRDNHHVIILKRSFSDVYRIEEHLNMITSYDIDITSLDEIFVDEKIDVIIHAATSYGRNGSISEQFESNVLFPIKLLEKAVKNQVCAFINTDTFFNKVSNQSYNYLNAYSKSKRYFLDLSQDIYKSNKIKFINARLEHVYGPNDSLSKFTNHSISQLLNNVSSLKLTPGDQKRDFIFVDDVVSAYCNIIENLYSLDESYIEYEIGTGISIPIKKFIEISHSLTMSKTRLLFGDLPYRDSEIMDSYADTSKLKEIGWDWNMGIEEGIKIVIANLLSVN